MPEADIVVQTLVEFGALPDLTIWRVNTGQYWAPTTTEVCPTCRNPKAWRRVRTTINGSADVSGISGPQGRRIEIELKHGKGKQRPDQILFEEMIRRHNGVYVLAYSADEVGTKLRAEGIIP
jgi:hypothetical protein